MPFDPSHLKAFQCLRFFRIGWSAFCRDLFGVYYDCQSMLDTHNFGILIQLISKRVQLKTSMQPQKHRKVRALLKNKVSRMHLVDKKSALGPALRKFEDAFGVYVMMYGFSMKLWG
ncbi:uncharacterized protein LOC132285045 [Cornus florida]|uniref:uncharacterized protein LOC132285045 n=1 Tax=Cornus florida TaxID=4283 RepID=UPI00289E6534|nr:uncharacterized protein LOC132285045 [Cornus florida]